MDSPPKNARCREMSVRGELGVIVLVVQVCDIFDMAG